LAKAYRSLNQTQKEPKRICIETVSDILLHYKADTTRKWLTETKLDLNAKGLTILAVINPSAHPTDQTNAILDLFDGKISLFEAESELECKRYLRIKKLRNQDYIKNPICLTKQT
jgi:KaiC/GvpD/RAD55 family RecA-like ATPase